MSQKTKRIVHQGWCVEVVEGCAWLTQDGQVTHKYEERGVWDEVDDAHLAAARSLGWVKGAPQEKAAHD